ncbi:ATP-binding cassette subfamily C protein [Actinoplanes campanulatus]|uniref:ATP-binding cassette subfamily C protein n=1 Tax=Actinoplanes campanulatus TaxID=113559 RepID=A0A7W5FJ98_9ACTN|nr:ABC transporter ATP-binding protein [Actinoplanes campanulatus]MBB3100285.1 ATP-binding cassette subfamily C protein [Actinoplanes campanulatus]GGN44067.1 ABC transporter permease [Actinoplanes campanulatus]GID40913.1 ABC transporter permease [Actinoplanes campanulatus]
MTGTSAVAEDALPVADGRETAREVWRLSRGHRLRLAVVGVLGIVSTTVDLIPPVAIGFLIDRAQAGTAGLGTVLTVTAVMTFSAVLGTAGTAVTIVLATRAYHAVLAALREELVARALTLPQHAVERAGAGDLISRSSDDVTAVADAAPAVIPVVTVTAFTITVSLGGLAALDRPYAAALAVVLPVYVFAMRWYLRTGPPVYRAERAAMSARAQQIVESQRGHATVLGFGLGEQRHRTVMTASWAVAVQTLRARTVQSMLNARLNLGECLSLAAVLVVGFVLIDHGTSTVGGATTAMLLVLRLLSPVNQLMFVIDTLQSALASLNRMIGVTTMPVADTADEPPTPRGTAHAVRLRGVAFGYGTGPRVLEDITLDIPTGQRIAVVGASGAGKTTLASVIAGIHPPDTGTVARPGSTAVITQEIHVFAGTLRDNLTLAAPDATDDQLRAALDTTGAAELLDLLPDGLDTMVGVGGHPLTDAQAQQLALARLLLTDPDLAILDEATAEAGSTQSGLLDRAADAALAGRTGLVIAHRLTQAAACDRIVVMEHGRITENGTHADLIAAGGVYARLWSAWEAGQGAGVV